MIDPAGNDEKLRDQVEGMKTIQEESDPMMNSSGEMIAPRDLKSVKLVGKHSLLESNRGSIDRSAVRAEEDVYSTQVLET